VPRDMADNGPTPLDLDLARELRNDVGNARRFMARYGDRLVFVEGLGWHAWTATHWSLERGIRFSQIAAQETACAIYREAEALRQAGKPKAILSKDWQEHLDRLRGFANMSGNSARLASMQREAEPHLCKRVEQLDADPYLFNVANGTVELSCNPVLREHRAEDLITHCSPVLFDAAAKAPRWQQFLERVLPDIEVRIFVQTWFGYCLTGSISEQVMALFHGGGANGKSTLVTVMLAILGDYGCVLPFGSLKYDDRKRGSEATPDLAKLPGKRFVSAAEPNPGTRLDESLIKTMTGGDRMTARQLNMPFIEFDPKFKLTLSFNPKPQIRGQDLGTWRRLLMTPFEVTIPEEEREQDLDKWFIANELAGIFNWMLDGARLWFDGGLQPPAAVRAATQEYRTEMDKLGAFVASELVAHVGGQVSAKAMYRTYVRWCKENAEDPVSQTMLGRMLGERGYHRIKVGTRYYIDVELVNEAPAPNSEADYGAAEGEH
jgi:putative DNA primase/helicase